MGRKRRRDRRQARRGQAPTFKRYQMRQQLVSLGHDFHIENEQGEKVFKVDGKVLRVRDTLVFRDMQGEKLCQDQECLTRFDLCHLPDDDVSEFPPADHWHCFFLP